jgi:hypothetical protein
MSQEISPIRSALYYPFPFVKDESWLKSAALFWDHVYRIVPPRFSYMELANEQVREPSETAKIFHEGFDFIRDYEIPPSGVETGLASFGLLEMMDAFPDYFAAQMSSEEPYFSWGDVEITKVNYEAVNKLKERGAFIKERGYGHFRFKDFPGRVYMALLAKSISAKHDISIVTDDSKHDLILQSYLLAIGDSASHLSWFLQSDLDADKALMSKETWDMALCNLTYESIGIQDLSKVSAAQIVNVRQKYDGERIAFVNEVQKYVDDLCQQDITSQRQLKFFLADKAAELKRKQQAYEKAVKGPGINTCFELAKVGTPLPLVGYIAKYLTISEPITVLASGSIAVGALLFKIRHDRLREQQSKPIGFYLSQLSRDLSGKAYLERISEEVTSMLKNKIF